ncbi:hypothetical protein QLX08_003318 [Tetragonisca angustula]|uniref:Protein CUSTOS n=1 Tax=Tetragonisca angustula TaxID=166442 RepID=A0AAW1A6Z7_9HYME
MSNKHNGDSSSSEDEISKDALKEAIDHQFLKNDYFSNEKFQNSDVFKKTDEHNDLTENTNVRNLVSLRKDLEEKKTFSNFGVSPTFQSFVAKKLDEIIEKSIKIKKKDINSIINKKEDKDNNCGIKLLNSSVEFLTTEKEDEKSQRKRKIEATIDDEMNLLKCKQVAVDPEQILSKVETKAWTSRRKGPEFNYKKLKNGTLVEKTIG